MSANVDANPHQIEIEDVADLNAVDENVVLNEKQHQEILEYLTHRLTLGAHNRTTKLTRMAKIDQFVSTWQKLSPEDSLRQAYEDNTGKHQALPINMPLIAAHIDDSVSFFTEVFAPVGGQFFAMPGRKDLTQTVKILTDKMEEDMKQSAYYAAVASTMRTLCKYNIGGFWLDWKKRSRLSESDGNVIKPVDVYNFLYDPSIKNLDKLSKDGEWAADIEVRNRIWLIRQAESEGFQNLDKVVGGLNSEGQKMNSFQPGKANYYKHPPSQTNLGDTGADTTSGRDQGAGIDWDSYGLGLTDDNLNDIEGHEVITMYIWINPDQFKLERTNEESLLELWKFRIIDSTWIVSSQMVADMPELPVYMTRMNQDEMGEAARSLAEQLRPFQRFISFLLNTHVEGIRKNVWGLTVYDPSIIDASGIKNGETSGLVSAKISGRDLRTALIKLDSTPDTGGNIATAGEFMNLMKQLFPNQAMPSQIAGMDRAVSSQVSAVMQGSMRKMHMLVRSMDSSLMLPVRMAMYRNIALYDADKSMLSGIKPEEVASLLGSGLGQINREAAAEQLRTIIFALIQNPDSMGQYDIAGLFALWSMLMNIGTDLSEFVSQAAPVPPGVDPATGQPIPTADPASAGAMPSGVA